MARDQLSIKTVSDPGDLFWTSGMALAMTWCLAGCALGASAPAESHWISLFNGKDLTGWTPKITGYELGHNYGNTFRVEDGVIKVRYDQYEKFELARFRDPNSYFVASRQTKEETIRILEQPGLWNGCMAYWNSVFVTVPARTVHPVKTVLDLLNQPQVSRS